MNRLSLRLEALASQEEVPPASPIPLCQTCSAAVFCGFD
ncbi:CRISPR-associated protein Cas4 [Desulfatibacillum alkenivorans]|nr:CRISPR-associated protein Cas4 [Desulfatibacillum alkenivorans]